MVQQYGNVSNLNEMTTLSENHPRVIQIITHPKGHIIFCIFILCGLFLFNSFFFIFRPYEGFELYQEAPLGEVYEVYPGSPAEKAGFQIGDLVTAIEGRLINPLVVEPRYQPWIKPGDRIVYEIQRQNEKLSLTLTIGNYLDNLPLLGQYLGIEFLSFGLWGIGFILTLFAVPDDVRARLLSLGFVLAGLTAAVGGASGWNSFWGANTIQKILLSLLAPIIIIAHLTFPSIQLSRYRGMIFSLTSGISLVISLFIIIEDWFLKTGETSLRQMILVNFMAAWLIAVGLLIYNRFLQRDVEIRRQTGIIIWGMVLGIGPFFILTLLPYILFGTEYLPGITTILFLLLLPLAYTYVIFQRKLLKIDFYINRILVWFTLILMIFLASILIFGALVIPLDMPTNLPIIGGIVATLITLPTTSVSKILQKQVDRILYGSHYDYTTVTSMLSRQLAQTLDRDKLNQLLTQDLPQQMGIQQAAMFLRDNNSLKLSDQLEIHNNDEVYKALLDNRIPMRATKLSDNIHQDDVKWGKLAWGQVFAPLIYSNDLQGILILGQRNSGDIYSGQDLTIITTVAEQGALAVSNIMLIERLRGLTQQLVRTSEEERKRLASDLHDTILQDLFFLKQGLHQTHIDPELIYFLEESIRKLRQTIREQRPPMLKQALPMELQGLVETTQNIAGDSTQISWRCNLQKSIELSDDQAINIYSIAQEALNNAVKYAHASHIQVSIEYAQDGLIHLKVYDDGVGLPSTKGKVDLIQSHFGLVLMQERAMMIHARIGINSIPGEGTTIELEVPL